MKRPKPTQQLLIELCGANHGLISSAHHGLYEVSLNEFYSNLNLDEIVVFAAASWELRKHDSFLTFAQSADMYDIFSKVFERGFPWLNKNKRISEKSRERYNKLNPFRRNLKGRLERADSRAIETLKERLQKGVNDYVFESQYNDRKKTRDDDNYRLVLMNFQNVFPKKGKIVPKFASEIARMISRYPSDYCPLENKAQLRFL